MHRCEMNNITSIYTTITKRVTNIKKDYKQNNFDQIQRQILGQK